MVCRPNQFNPQPPPVEYVPPAAHELALHHLPPGRDLAPLWWRLPIGWETGALWRVRCEATNRSGSGVVTFFVVTSSAGELPDVGRAYRTVEGDRGARVYLVEFVQRVTAPFEDGFPGTTYRDVADQRRGVPA